MTHSSEKPVADPAPSARSTPDLPAMRASFIADFVGGRIGRHHNTFQHRERVLRQLTQAQLRVEAGPEPSASSPHSAGGN